MGKVSELREAIKTRLITAHPRVHYEDAPDNAVYPYLVFNLPDSLDDGSLENFVLDVDGWDRPAGGDTTALETMMDDADQALNNKAVSAGASNEFVFIFRRDNRLSLNDDEPSIKRRKYIYQARTFERRG